MFFELVGPLAVEVLQASRYLNPTLRIESMNMLLG